MIGAEQIITSGWVKPKLLNYLLLPVSLVYWILFSIHRGLYRLGFKRSYRAPVPVIVVGNLTVGGTGKTPTVIALCKELTKRGKQVAVISRGYASQGSHSPQLIDFSKSSETGLKAQNVGDEPLLIAKHTKLPVMVGSNRQKSIEALLGQYKLDVIVSDDGLQHHALLPDIKICLHDKTIARSNRFLLPSGPYREAYSNLQHQEIVLEHMPIGESVNLAGQAGRFSMVLNTGELVQVNQSPSKQLQAPQSGDTVHAVAGIGNPARFFNTLEKLGYKIIQHAFPDHYSYTSESLRFGDSNPIIMTEKDAVKCTELGLDNLWYLSVEMHIDNALYDLLEQKLAKLNK
jgi:tetraacyldisaccharide 4'-kinase